MEENIKNTKQLHYSTTNKSCGGASIARGGASNSKRLFVENKAKHFQLTRADLVTIVAKLTQ